MGIYTLYWDGFFEGRLNEDAYIDMLGNYIMIPSVYLLSLPGTWIFMCCTPYHTIYSCNA